MKLSPVTLATHFLWPWVVNQRGLDLSGPDYFLCDTYPKSDSRIISISVPGW